MTTLNVACLTLRSGLDVMANVETVLQLLRNVAAGGAELIATPEMTGLIDRAPGAVFTKSVRESEDQALKAFRDLARELKITLLIGSLSVRVDEKKCANRSYLIGQDGEVISRYDKIHMFDVALGAGNVYRESDSFAAGSEAVLANLPGVKLGLTICYDVRFGDLFRSLALAGAQVIAVPAAFTRITGEAHWHVLLRARAIETGCYIIAPAQGGRHEDGRETYGHSLIIDPWGEIIAEGGVEPGYIQATLDLSKVDEVRRKIPSLTHIRDFKRPQ